MPNGIESRLMRAYGEGFDILNHKSRNILPEDKRYTLAIGDIAEVWRWGGVVSSWLPEGRRTGDTALEKAVAAMGLAVPLFARFHSRHAYTFGETILATMCFGFGEHHKHMLHQK